MILLTALLVAAAPLPEPKPANELYGDTVVAILNGATRVEIARYQPFPPTPVEVKTFEDGRRDGGPIEGGKNQAEAVAKLIVADARKPFTEGDNRDDVIGFRLWMEKENVVALLDLANRTLLVIGHDADGKVIKRTYTVAQPVTYNKLLKRAQDALPDDATLRRFQPIPEK